jgi:hypothetical protein
VAAVRRDLVRSAEWHRVRDFAQQVRASPAALAIQGEAGAGKSTLWRAGTETAADPLTAGAPPPSRAWQELLDAVPASAALDLAPLDMWQIQNLLPRDVTAAEARLVARQSRGNPFWALQVSASLGTAPGQVPPLARTLTDRLSRSLTDSGAAALATVAAAGRIMVPEVLAVPATSARRFPRASRRASWQPV